MITIKQRSYIIIGIIIILIITAGFIGYYLGLSDGIGLQVNRYEEWISNNCICDLIGKIENFHLSNLSNINIGGG